MANIPAYIINIFSLRLIRSALGPLTGGRISDPAKKLTILERWSARATLLILVGILGEIAAMFIFFRPELSWTERSVAILCDLFIGVGLGVEYICIIQTIDASSVLQRTSEERVAESNRLAREAQLELAKFRSSRYLTTEQQAAISETLRPFAGSIFDTGWSLGTSEQQDFAWVLEPTLTEAGWTQIDWSDGGTLYIYRGGHRPIAGVVSVADVSIQLHPGSEALLSPAALALAAALRDIGIAAAVDPFNVRSTNENAIHVMIGMKR
jgi:hypothetical protein